MRKLDNARKLLTRISVSLGAALSALQGIFFDDFTRQLGVSEAAMPLINGITAFFIIVFAVLSFVFLTNLLLDKSRFIRKLFLNSDFIEGAWVDIVFDQFEEKVIGGGLLYIYRKGGTLVVKGETFNPDGTTGGQFLSNSSSYDENNQTINFVYSINLDKEAIAHVDGMGSYSFHTNGKQVPNIFWGYFFANGTERRYDVYGEKLSWKVAEKHLKMSLKERGELVKAFIEKNQDLIIPQVWREKPPQG